MIKIASPFELHETSPRHFGMRLMPGSAPASQTASLALEGALVSLETAGKTFDLSTREAPAGDTFRSKGLSWGRQVVPLGRGVLLEQQLFRANGGNTVALSWRLLGAALAPVRLTVTPIFTASTAISTQPFAFEPETDGGRLVWQPFRRAAKIIADTNGRCTAPPALDRLGRQADVALPGAFEFSLGRSPSILVFSVDPQGTSASDPLIGGFLAQLAQPREQDYLRRLAAA